MASPIYIAYALVKILQNGELHTVRGLANALSISSNTVFNHVSEMNSQGLVKITHGKYGGVRWIT